MTLRDKGISAAEIKEIICATYDGKSFLSELKNKYPELINQLITADLVPDEKEHDNNTQKAGIPTLATETPAFVTAPVASSNPASQAPVQPATTSATETLDGAVKSIYPTFSQDNKKPARVIPSAPRLERPAEEMHIDTPGADKPMLKSMPLSLLDDSPLSMPLATQPGDTDLIRFTEVGDLLRFDSQPDEQQPAMESATPSLSSGLAALSLAFFKPAANPVTTEQAPAQNTGLAGDAVPPRTMTHTQVAAPQALTHGSRNRERQLA